MITNEFKQTLLSKITILDRARAHRNSLTTSKEREGIRQKLQIWIQPLVINKQQPEFKLRWEQPLKTVKQIMESLIEHLNSDQQFFYAFTKQPVSYSLTTSQQ